MENVAIEQDNAAPLATFLECAIGGVTGYAVSDDGMFCVLRTATQDGHELRLTIPTMLIAAMQKALQQVKNLAAMKTEVVAGNTNVFLPVQYETITTANFDGVLLAFDRGAPSEIIIGLDSEAAINMGHALRKQVRSKRIIVPDKEIIT